MELSAADVGAGLAHDGFAAEFVEVEEEFGLLGGGFLFWHEWEFSTERLQIV